MKRNKEKTKINRINKKKTPTDKETAGKKGENCGQNHRKKKEKNKHENRNWRDKDKRKKTRMNKKNKASKERETAEKNER